MNKKKGLAKATTPLLFRDDYSLFNERRVIFMTQTLNFDKQSAAATKNREFKIAYIRHVEQYINDLLERKGYVYLNTIYENLGIEWDPFLENTVYIYDRENPRLIMFDVNEFEVDEDLIITILH
jgi:hypothetical protein